MSEVPSKAPAWLRWVVGLCFAAIGGTAALLVTASKASPPERALARASEETTPKEAAVHTAAHVVSTDVGSSESALMIRLHSLGENDPATTLNLALEGNLRFPNGEAAPERGWMICKSLVNLRRFSEAVEVARIVVERYPNTPWATDVQRHLLVNPMTDPSERGYGRELELD